MRRNFKRLLTLAVLLFLAGCGGGGKNISGSLDTPIQPAERPGLLESVAQSGDFKLQLLSESHQFGGGAEYSLVVYHQGAETVVEVQVDAQDLRLSLFELSYDQYTLHPLKCESGAWPADLPNGLIELAILGIPGTVHYGAVIPYPQSTIGAYGQFTLIKLTFAAGPVGELRGISAAPMSAASMVPDLAITQATGDTTFSYYNNGDYDQNSEVNIADITPLGALFGSSSGGGPFDPATWESVVDGDSNGEINIADLTPIGANFLASVLRYTLYGGDLTDYPSDAGDDNGAGHLMAEIQFDTALGESTADRLHFAQNVVEIPLEDHTHYWLRPTDGTTEGIASNLVEVGGGGGDVTPPVWTIAEASGVLDVIPGNGEVEVIWGEATDAESPPVVYRVYYMEGATLDHNLATTVEVPASAEGGGALTTISGLDNGTQYAFAVRALDSAVLPNEENNEVVMTATPDLPQEMPSLIDGDTTFTTPMMVSDGNTVNVTGGAQVTCEGGLDVDGSIIVTEDGACFDIDGDLTVTGSILLDLPDDPLPGGEEDTGSLCIVARGDVDFGPDSSLNGDGNIFLVDDPAEVLTPLEAVNETENDTNPGDWPFNWMPDDAPAFAMKGGSFAPTKQASSHIVYYGPRRTWLVRGDWGKVPIPRPGTKRIVLRIRQRNGEIQFQDWNIEGPDGRPGANMSGGCDVTGEDGKDNPWRMLIQTSRSLVFNNVTIKFGDGGRGGDATTDLDCCPGIATGGNGGKPNNKFRFSAGSEIKILGTFNLNPGAGGRGGDADAFARDGVAGCPGEDGCDATATGGAGGDAPKWGIAVRGNVNGIGNLQLGMLRGGRGGDATAIAGNGGPGNPCCDGGNGGNATATGGKGGNSEFKDTSTGAGGGGAQGGDGGDAFTFGGDGGKGGDCFKAQAGSGGDGGTATSNGGGGGTASGNGATQDGNQGNADAWGGNGGDGGNGCPPGGGGAGGIATAMGTLTNFADGLDGAMGVEWPEGCQWIWCIPILSCVPDPTTPGVIPPGFSTLATLLDSVTQEEVGTVPITFDGPPGCISWDFQPVSNDPFIIVQNFDPEQPVHIDIEITELQLSGSIPFTGVNKGDLGLTSAQKTMGTDAIGFLKLLDLEMVPIVQTEILPMVPSTDPVPQALDFHDSFFDVTYQIEIAPNSIVSFEEICIWDP